ncbi:hypothetical protein Q5P01_018696 [Channa striata]|uniref:Uncharacterized protein n=1 Tax=Channa striata TaxID=64152 RepID=A0AA88S8P7_CHASR|nr:hypothetical protein Q5P01_018696 [Channa striata]
MAAAARLVSRGGSGIGRAVCQRFASEGASVVVADISQAAADETLGSLRRDVRGPGHMAAVVDVSSKDSVTKLLTRIQTNYFQPPSVCVNAAGITQDDFLLNLDEQQFDRVIQVNLKGSFLVTRLSLRLWWPVEPPKDPSLLWAALWERWETLDRQITPPRKLEFGIRCNCVLPGFISTPMTDKVPEKVISKMKSLVPMGRMGEPEEVADVCAFLASDDSRYITGASIEVTGGLFIG